MSTRTRFPTHILSFIVLGSFVTFVLFLGISQEAEDYARNLKDSLVGSIPGSSSQKKPDLDLYIWRATLSDEELDFDDSDRRVLFVGDIHGMKESLDKLLNKVHYNPDTDHLIHAGDIVAKAPLDGSLEVLDFMTAHNITGVRGNHDQMVVGWRAWIENVLSQPGGASWLESLEETSKKDRKVYLKELKKAFENGKNDKGEKWKKIPDDWEFMGDHYTVARRMNDEQAEYLRTLPLVLHIPRLHTFVVHAGLLPLDPRRRATSSRQPLSHPPENEEDEVSEEHEDGVMQRLRVKQEEALLDEIPQNRDPWVVLNVRSILKDNSISKDSKEGSAWAPLWNSIISRCGGFSLDLDPESDADTESDSDSDVDDDDDGSDIMADKKMGIRRLLRITKEKPLPCYPSTVVYGHAASRGLDIRRWSKGLDTGCVYGRRLTALVLTPPSHDLPDDDDSDDDDDDDDFKREDRDLHAESREKKMRFGDPRSKTANARVVSVACPDV